MTVPTNEPIPSAVMDWVRRMGPLHLCVGHLAHGWNDLTITNVSGGQVSGVVNQFYKDDGTRVITIRVELPPKANPNQVDAFDVVPSPALLSAGPRACEYPRARGRGACVNKRGMVKATLLDGSEVVMCSFHGHRAKRDGDVRVLGVL